MKEYVEHEMLAAAEEHGRFLQYPNIEANKEQFIPGIEWGPNITPSGGLYTAARPSDLLLDTLHIIGDEPQVILDVGAETGRNSLLMAHMGHHVVAIESDESNAEYISEQAKIRGLEDNVEVRHGKLEELPAEEEYDVVLAQMVLHFLKVRQIDRSLRSVLDATAQGGLAIVSAYTTDNPREERTERGVHYMFRPGELGAMILHADYDVIENREGVLRRAMKREIKDTKCFLFPTIAEVIAVKL